MWDSMLNKITAWAQNHESRLQARASSSADYPNLTSADTSFTHLIDARKSNGNKLTEQMWDSLQTQLSKVALNHEMRLRMQASQPTQPSTQNGKIQIAFPQTYHLYDLLSAGGLPTVRANLISDITGLPALKYFVKDTARFHINDDGTSLAASQWGRGEVCAYTTYNGLRVEGCTSVVAQEKNTSIAQPVCEI